VQLDLFHEIPLPPQRAIDEARAYAEVMAQVELGDRLGFGCAWLVEHHFMPGYSHCSKPELVLAALAARTRRIRLGLAVVPLPLHHPVHVAERVATLDLLSAGRLEVGIGRGFSPLEYRTFGVEMADSRSLVDESLAILRAGLAGGPVEHRGRHWPLQDCTILPRAVQRPHPPLWTAAVSPETFGWAAAEGLGALVGPFKPWPMVRHDLRRYLAGWTHASAPRIGITVGIVCLRDGERARRLARDAFRWFYSRLYEITLPVLERLYPSYEQLHALGRFRRLMKLGIDLGFLETFGLAIAGTPEECIRRLRRFERAGITRVLCAVGAGVLPHETTEEVLHCLGRDVLPAFAPATPAPAPAC